MVGLWARVPLLTSSARLGALGEALIFPVIQLVKILPATEEAICLFWGQLRTFPVARSCITGTLRCWLGPLTFVHRQVSHRLRERQEHLAPHHSHLGPHAAGNRAGRPGFGDESAVGKQTRGQDEKPQARGHGGCGGLHPTCRHGPALSRDVLRALPPRPAMGASV